ncbi:alanine racemase [Sanguibacter sp. A247]|uniref:alanine racemase n=1 Tax=unclassified Sanguibacter TaxID=2645534 RepID=UPI003FD80C64
MNESWYPARALVDLEAVRGNVRALRDAAPGAAVMAVVKADAYGHGLVPVARAALAAGATWLGVAQPAEALALRAAGLTARTLTWLYAPGAPLADLVAADVDVSVHAPWAVEEVGAAARAAGRTARVHLKVDTGLGRSGVLPDRLPEVLARLMALQSDGLVTLVGVWSHLAFADEPEHPTVLGQVDVFDGAVALAERMGAHLEVRHLANSAATLTTPRAHYDLVRPGLAVYGLTPVPQLGGPERYGLRPAMTLEASLATVKDVPAGQGVSYGHAFRTPRATVLGDVPLGYGDGIPRHASGTQDVPGAPILVGTGPGARTLHVTGRVCMDQLMIDLGPGANERAGETVVLFGDPATGAPSAQDWAEACGTISYEIITRLGARVPRIHRHAEENPT